MIHTILLLITRCVSSVFVVYLSFNSVTGKAIFLLCKSQHARIYSSLDWFGFEKDTVCAVTQRLILNDTQENRVR